MYLIARHHVLLWTGFVWHIQEFALFFIADHHHMEEDIGVVPASRLFVSTHQIWPRQQLNNRIIAIVLIV